MTVRGKRNDGEGRAVGEPALRSSGFRPKGANSANLPKSYVKLRRSYVKSPNSYAVLAILPPTNRYGVSIIRLGGPPRGFMRPTPLERHCPSWPLGFIDKQYRKKTGGFRGSRLAAARRFVLPLAREQALICPQRGEMIFRSHGIHIIWAIFYKVLTSARAVCYMIFRISN